MSKFNPFLDIWPPMIRCPICKGNLYTHHEPNGQYYITCQHCGYKEGGTSIFNMIEKWNNRNGKERV